MRRAVVTGLGAVTPFGIGVKAYWNGLASGVCAIRPATLLDTEGLRCRLAAEVPDALPGSRRRSRADRLALAAAAEALDDARLERADRREVAVVVGAVGGGMFEAEQWYWDGGADPARASARRALRAVLPWSHAEVVANALGLHGPRETLITACSSGAAALAVASDLVTTGMADVVLAGGADAITRICYLGFNALKLLDPGLCRPFDRERRGMSIGEGAGFLVIEEAGHARGRGARAYAELAGCGMASDAYHVTSPDPEGRGMVRAMADALAASGVEAADVGYANAHGTATPQNDRVEALALREVFGAGRLLVSSTKSMIGHTMAAAGSLEAMATVLALVHEIVPPTANLSAPDPEVAFDCVPQWARHAALEHAISNSFGFGGQNVTLLFRRAAA
jgi:3-oxoacyl-[acyl-carrier-protein] synthase II